jgi:polyhydroxyalkanoate synthase
MKTCDRPGLAADRATEAGSVNSIVAQSALPYDNEVSRGAAFRAIDRMREALSGMATGGLSPAALTLAATLICCNRSEAVMFGGQLPKRPLGR